MSMLLHCAKARPCVSMPKCLSVRPLLFIGRGCVFRSGCPPERDKYVHEFCKYCRATGSRSQDASSLEDGRHAAGTTEARGRSEEVEQGKLQATRPQGRGPSVRFDSPPASTEEATKKSTEEKGPAEEAGLGQGTIRFGTLPELPILKRKATSEPEELEESPALLDLRQLEHKS